MKHFCDRRVFYDSPRISIPEAHLIIHCTALREAHTGEVVHNTMQFNVNDVSDWSRSMQAERMGTLYRLYCIGWRNGSTQHFSPLLHYLLSAFFYYRRGFTEGANWQQEQRRTRMF